MKFVSFKSFSVNRYSKKSVFILLLLLFATVSCSKKQFAVSSLNTRSSNLSSEMQSFIKGGAELKLDTGRKKPKQIIRTAEKYLGTPHCMGGTTKKCLDCSGLTYLSFTANKINIPRRSQDQARYGKLILNKSELKKGDLVFFTKSYNSPDYITHVGIYLGNSRFIHASTSKGVVITEIQNPWWSERFVFGTRVF
ncbi:MAG TPA: C40 family peptidase [Draconibacterium sp.]|nr:C40 family peptidase [Draconibacterium sp.]